jgi:hypothetical protein
VVETQGDQVRIKRDGDTATEVIGATLPLVLSVTDQSGEARYPSFKGIMAAKKKPLETWSLADLGVDAGQVGLSVAWTAVEDTTARPPRTAGEIVKDEDGSGATRWPSSSPPRSSSEEPEEPCLRVLVLVDHVDGAVKKPTYELLTIAKRLGEPSAVFIGSGARPPRCRGGQEVRRREGLRRRRRRDQGLPRRPQGRGAAAAGGEDQSPARPDPSSPRARRSPAGWRSSSSPA